MSFRCGGCSMAFRTRRSRDEHFEATGHCAPKRECPAPACPEVKTNDRMLWEHMKKCGRLRNAKFRGMPWEIVYWFCETCQKLFSSAMACIGYECDRCDGYFETLTALTRHLIPILTMEIAEARVREELYARVEEKDRRGFLRGIKSEFKVPENHVDDKIHRREDHYVCHLCSTVFDKADGLREHFYSHAHAVHHYCCISCNTKFRSLGWAISHLEIECKHCFKKQASLGSK